MASYWRVSPKFWTDPKVLAWDDDTRLLALYILTCPHRSTEGLFRLPKRYVLADLEWSPERLAQPFAQLLTDGFIDYDETVQVCLIVKALEYQSPENPNQVKAALRVLADLPPSPRLTCTFKGLAERLCERLAERLPEGFGEPPAPAPAPTPAPTRAETDAAPTGNQPSAAPSAPKRTPPDGFLDWWAGYPRKIGRAEAEAAFAKALKRGASLDLLVKTLTASREQWQRENRPTDKVPHAATWLNKERWRDEPEPAKAAVSYETPKVVYP